MPTEGIYPGERAGREAQRMITSRPAGGCVSRQPTISRRCCRVRGNPSARQRRADWVHSTAPNNKVKSTGRHRPSNHVRCLVPRMCTASGGVLKATYERAPPPDKDGRWNMICTTRTSLSLAPESGGGARQQASWMRKQGPTHCAPDGSKSQAHDRG